MDKRSTAYDYETYEVDRAPRAQVRFASLADAAALRPGSYDAVLLPTSTWTVIRSHMRRARWPR